MGFKARRAKRSGERHADLKESDFQHSSGASNLDALLFDHTLDEAAEAQAPKGYRNRSVAKAEKSRQTR